MYMLPREPVSLSNSSAVTHSCFGMALAYLRVETHKLEMSPYGPLSDIRKYASNVAFGGKADITFCSANVRL
jgi:hypothetical protein